MQMSERITDEELLRRTAEGCKEAFALLVERHRAAVYRLARAMTRSVEAAEDVLQETFLAAMRAAADFRGEAKVRTWLLTIARNVALQHGRLRSGEPEAFLPIETLSEASSRKLPELKQDIMEPILQREELLHALERLTEDDREVLVLRELEGLSGEEAASVLGITPTAMKSRLHRARLRLASVLLEGTGGGEGEER